MKPVVLFYSFSGSTKRVAEILARRLGAPAVEIKTREPIRHPFGVGFLNRIRARTPEIAIDADLDAFDTFYVGGPTWYWTVTPPLLTLLRARSLEFAVEAAGLKKDVSADCGVKTIDSVRVFNRYDVSGLTDEEYELDNHP